MHVGVLNIDKPAGATSFTVVRQLRSLTGAKRVGHAGTLDPLATGVLPILFGPATRLSDYAHRLPKTYEASIHLGFTTPTDDAEADRSPVGDPSHLGADEVDAALQGFVGRILQQPPAFSAVKTNGERAYKRARSGDTERPAAREVEIHEIELLGFEASPEAVARVRVSCASGVYLRSLARDVGEKLGVGGYLGRLVRTAYGPLTVTDACSMDDLRDREAVESRVQPAEVILPGMVGVRLTPDQEALVRQGRAVRVLPPPPLGPVRAHDHRGNLFALGHADPLRRTFVPDKVLG
jgi:tRNA pseudouridine55 synthase